MGIEGVADHNDVCLLDVRVSVAAFLQNAAVEEHVDRHYLHLVEEVQVTVDDLALVHVPLRMQRKSH